PSGPLQEQTQAGGRELTVGPGSKQKLEALEGLGPRVAVLGLNYLEAARGSEPGVGQARATETPAPTHPEPPFLQLGLAIEDEAATITELLLARDLQRLLAIRGTEDWAVRGARTLTDTWPYDIELREFTDVRTVTESVGAAMGVAASEERRESLERLLNTNLEFLPRARSDLDGVVAFVDHLEATALAPALKYHLAGRVPPVYASSQSVRNATTLAELSGFHVTEMPFNLYADPLWDEVKAAFGGGGGNVAALRSLGMDAFRIVSLWGWVADGEPVYGATGRLRLERGGQVRRRLAWASVSGGRVRPMTATAVP
ncbi:MAG: penicillin-binding protein activator, partial [Gammaproteobacteria bacterium]|nr:penicillin-binding protein activator [Gammaproteobacteria bacterium]